MRPLGRELQDLHSTVVRENVLAHDRQSETGTPDRGRDRLRALIERIEDPAAFLLGDPGAGVGNVEHCAIARPSDPDVDRFAGRRVLDGVGKQVVDDDPDLFFVPGDGNIGAVDAD